MFDRLKRGSTVNKLPVHAAGRDLAPPPATATSISKSSSTVADNDQNLQETSSTAALDAEKQPAPDLEAQPGVNGWADPYGAAPGFRLWCRLFWHDILACVLPPRLAHVRLLMGAQQVRVSGRYCAGASHVVATALQQVFHDNYCAGDRRRGHHHAGHVRDAGVKHTQECRAKTACTRA